VIIGYLPVLYQAFSRREVTISLMDARAGSPPTGGEALVRLAQHGRGDAIDAMLREWEQWAAELLESHISFPVLAFYRSQHANQSWLAALATMLDACALLLTEAQHAVAGSSHQAQLTFAMARHAAVDLSLIFGVRPCPPAVDRLPAEAHSALREALARASPATAPEVADQRLSEIRGMYEPFLAALAAYSLLSLPPVAFARSTADHWQRSPSMPRTPGIGSLPVDRSHGDHHFD